MQSECSPLRRWWPTGCLATATSPAVGSCSTTIHHTHTQPRLVSNRMPPIQPAVHMQSHTHSYCSFVVVPFFFLDASRMLSAHTTTTAAAVTSGESPPQDRSVDRVIAITQTANSGAACLCVNTVCREVRAYVPSCLRSAPGASKGDVFVVSAMVAHALCRLACVCCFSGQGILRGKPLGKGENSHVKNDRFSGAKRCVKICRG